MSTISEMDQYKHMLLHSMALGIRDVEDLMSAHDLLNLINKLRKSDKMPGSLIVFSLFQNTTGTRMLDSIYHITLKLLKIAVWHEKVKNLSFLRM